MKAQEAAIPQKVAQTKMPLEKEIANLEQQLRSKDSQLPEKIQNAKEPLLAKISQLEGELNKARSSVPQKVDEARAPLQAKIESLQSELNQARGSIPEKVAQARQPLQEKRDGGMEVMLTIEQPAALAAQVALEDALRQHEKVESIVPTYLHVSSRQYRLRLKGEVQISIIAFLLKLLH